MKSYPYSNASREKTVKAARLKIFEIIDKSLSELLEKTANQKKVWFLSYIDSKKRFFPRRRANGVALRPLCVRSVAALSFSTKFCGHHLTPVSLAFFGPSSHSSCLRSLRLNGEQRCR
jgi:hypothetical protein